jgi:hypothetical protein
MAEALVIDRFVTRGRAPAAAAEARRRVDGMRELVTQGGLLEEAIARAGLPAHAEICVRRVRAVVRLGLDGHDVDLATSWALALAQRIRAVVEAGGPDVVVYGSRHEALVDLVARVAAADFGRAWAWLQLGLWAAGDEARAAGGAPGDAIGAALLRAPEAIAPVLAAASGRVTAPDLLGLLPAGWWPRLGRAALGAAGAPGDLLEATPEGGRAPDPRSQAALHTRAARLLEASPLAAVLAAAAGGRAPPPAVRAIAALALALPDPLWPRSASAPALLAAAVARAGTAASNGGAGAQAQPTAAGARGGIAASTDHDHDQPPGLTAAPAPIATGAGARPPAGPRAQATAATPDQEAVTGAAGAPAPAPDARARGRTDEGGLLFLLHLLPALALPERLARWADAGGRSSRFLLHALALALRPMAASDPAALAFAGLGPHAPPPSRGEAPLTPEEEARLADLRAEIVDQLRTRLCRPLLAEAGALLHAVCARRAHICADPGWIDVELELADVSTEVRRAALDLDLGYVPWLGVVVRFVYV